VLTVDYDRLDLQYGDLVLDMGAGAGRHAFETFRRGARVVAFDYSVSDLREVGAMFSAMTEAGEADADGMATTVNGDGNVLPFADNSFDKIICSEVLEHIPTDTVAMHELLRVLKPGGTLAATVPTWLPERICWALSDDYHAPIAEGGHVRIFTEAELRAKLIATGFEPVDSHHAHSLHSPYWWLKCAVGPTNNDNPAVKAYHKLLVWDMVSNPLPLRILDRVLNPIIGKSLIVYANKPA